MSKFDDGYMKKFDEFESAENVRNLNIVEFECKLRHIPSGYGIRLVSQ